MDPHLWLSALRLPIALRQRWMRTWREEREVSPALLDALVALAPEPALRRWSEELLERCRRAQVRVIAAVDATYPRVLERLHDPPLALFVRGDASLLRPLVRVGIVGARRGTGRGRRVAERMGVELARAGLPVVSGLALGVDGAAHRGCLAGDGRPVAVLGTGPDRTHPPSHRALQERVARAGLLVSEYPPGTPAHAHHFPARNRILAALSQAVVLVEAGERSGALATADFALQVQSEVLVVPGPVDCVHAVGTLALLRDGAVPVRHARDVLESLGHPVALGAPPGPLGLSDVPESSVEIARRLGWTLPRVLAALGEAEVLGQVRRVGADRWTTSPGASDLRPGRDRD